MLTNIRAAIIDLDGTMLDTVADIHCALNRMCMKLGLPPIDIEQARSLVGKGSDNLVRSVLALSLARHDAEQRFSEAFASYLRHYEEINGEFASLYSGVREGLAAMRAKGLRLACVTNKPIGLTLPLLQKKGLAGYFDTVYGGDSLPKKKPDPLPLLQVCRDFALPPSQIVAIGDSMNDAQAARAAGCRVLNVPYGYNHGQPIQDVDSDGIVETLLDAANLITP